MGSFEQYLPQGPKNNNDDINFTFNTLSGSKNPSWEKPWSNYRVVYKKDKDIDKTAYNKPWVRNYTMGIEDPSGEIKYVWRRREDMRSSPQEDYSKPPTLQRYNVVNFQWQNASFSIDTTNLEEFQRTIREWKIHIIKWYWVNSTLYKELEKQTIFTLADMQRVWSGEGNYNTSIIPSAGKVWKMAALKNSLNQIGKDIPSDETMFNQWSLGDNPEKIICRDFSIVTARIAKSLGFEAIAGTIEVWVSHAFTVMRSKETGMYYGISADSVGGPSKIFEWSSMMQIRERYQNELISLGRAQHFGWVYLDDTGKVVGKWQTDLEKRRANDFLGGETPMRLLHQSKGTDVALNHGKIGWVDYTSLIAQKWVSIDGKTLDADLFFRWGITNMRAGGASAYAFDAGIWWKLSTKPIEVDSWFTARAYVAADINGSVWYSQNKWTQVPYLSGNTVIWGQLKYENSKWVFTTDLWKSYELSGPNQMQRPLMKLLPSWEYAIFTWEYKGESMNILGRAVFENYFAAERRELSLGVRHNSGFWWAIYTRNEKNNIPGFPIEWSREMGIGATWDVGKNTQLKVEAGKKFGPQWPSNTVNAGINIQF
jgi:hypothetical protein